MYRFVLHIDMGIHYYDDEAIYRYSALSPYRRVDSGTGR